MTPFDAAALLVVLLTFYPFVSKYELARAKAERPSYFGGGVLFGSKGDKLKLPDGRVFDCIWGAGGLSPKWSVVEDTGGGGGASNPYPLEEGPLTPIDPELLPAPTPEAIFEPLAMEAIGGLRDAEDAYGRSHTELAEASDPRPFDDATWGSTVAAEQQLAEAPGTLEAIAPAELLEASATQDQAISSEGDVWNALEVTDVPEAPDPPKIADNPPPDDGGEENPPRET